jgi:pimeloyl-ACP methyl ester carboxylesterase
MLAAPASTEVTKMGYYRWAFVTVLLLVSSTGRLFAQQPIPWHDPSPHTVQFVTVDENVNLEVLDWGGSGRPLVLLAGLGNTAHVFDDFAPKLTPEYHVYGITRRGYGASSAPASGYSADQRGDDVLAVLDALKINRPVLVGHSIAGDELSSVGTRHPERVAGLIYLDAAYSNSFYDRSLGNVDLDSRALQKKLDQMRTASTPLEHKRLVEELVQVDLPDLEKELRELLKLLQSEPSQPVSPPAASQDDLANFPALRAYVARVRGINFPESELRQTHESRPDGGVGKPLPGRGDAISEGEQKYSDIRLPVLAFFANPRDPAPYAYNTPAERATFEALQTAAIEAQAKAFETDVPSARVVRVPHANHYVFLSNESDVLREMRAFLAGLH